MLVFTPVTLVDIRPLESAIEGLRFVQDDATDLIKFESNSVESLLEPSRSGAFWIRALLGSIDPDACFRFMGSLQRVLAPGGRLYFSVPIGCERVEFNAHRVFAVKTVLNSFSQLQLISFSLVGGDGRLYENVNLASIPISDACGLFEFRKSS